MLLAGMILGVVALGALTIFWKDIVTWLQKAINKVQEVIKKTVYGTKVFVQKLREASKEISKHYVKQGTKWQETVVERKIAYNELPQDIQAKVQYSEMECDITDELKVQLNK